MADLSVVEKAEKSETRKGWRKLVKKLQRKRRRQKAAKARDEEEAAKLKDPEYRELLWRQRELAAVQRIAAEQQHQEDEEAWLRRELLAQRQFAREQKEREAKETLEQEKRLQQEKELEERKTKLRLAAEERKRKEAEAAAEFERTMERMNEYLADEEMEPPLELQRIVESRPGAKVCEFFERTNCCRFGLPCVFSHRRPLLSSIIVIRHFFTHPLLEQSTGDEDISEGLENTEQDLRKDYDEFFNDVVPELETFGKILNFRTVRNTWTHLRGHVFVEYLDKRSALKAFIKLQGRYYASKRLNVEFSNLRSWRGAVCGLSVIRKCGKGNKCSYLHLFKNPDNKYNTLLEYTKLATPSVTRQMTGQTPSRIPILTPLLSWNEVEKNEPSRNWRWSESPEPESVERPRQGDQQKDPKNMKEPRKRSASRSRSESKKKRSRSRERVSRKRKKHKSKSKSRERSRRS